MIRKITGLILILGLLTACNETSETIHSHANKAYTKAIADSLAFRIEIPGDEIQLKAKIKIIEGNFQLIMKYPAAPTTPDSLAITHDTTAISIDTFQIVFDSMFQPVDTLYFTIDTIKITIDTTRIPPPLRVLYDTLLSSPGTHQITKKFDRVLGTWELKCNAEKTETNEPEGSFDIQVSYLN